MVQPMQLVEQVVLEQHPLFLEYRCFMLVAAVEEVGLLVELVVQVDLVVEQLVVLIVLLVHPQLKALVGAEVEAVEHLQ